jgi:hypothetical protein
MRKNNYKKIIAAIQTSGGDLIDEPNGKTRLGDGAG